MTTPVGFPDPFGALATPTVGQKATPAEQPAASDGATATPFAEQLEHIIDNADSAQRTAEQKATDFAEHRSNDLHGTMISMSQADIQLRFVASIRNKVIEAYREVMRMGA